METAPAMSAADRSATSAAGRSAASAAGHPATSAAGLPATSADFHSCPEKYSGSQIRIPDKMTLRYLIHIHIPDKT